MVIQVGEFEISEYGDGIVIIKDMGESMELSLDTLRRIWDENY
jgi:hypothetical protein